MLPILCLRRIPYLYVLDVNDMCLVGWVKISEKRSDDIRYMRSNISILLLLVKSLHSVELGQFLNLVPSALPIPPPPHETHVFEEGGWGGGRFNSFSSGDDVWHRIRTSPPSTLFVVKNYFFKERSNVFIFSEASRASVSVRKQLPN